MTFLTVCNTLYSPPNSLCMTFSGWGWYIIPGWTYKRPRKDFANHHITVTLSVNFKMKTNVIFIYRNSNNVYGKELLYTE